MPGPKAILEIGETSESFEEIDLDFLPCLYLFESAP